MKKVLLISIALALISLELPSFAMSFGMYHPAEEYGLFDGFKFNVKKRKGGQNLIELRSETQEEQERLEREKQKGNKKPNTDEYELFRFMRDGVVPF